MHVHVSIYCGAKDTPEVATGKIPLINYFSVSI